MAKKVNINTTKKGSKKLSISPLEIKKKKRQKLLHSSIVKIFKQMGFEYINTNDIHKEFGGMKSEIDDVFVFENLILICEETISDSDRDHLRKKSIYFKGIQDNKGEFLEWLTKLEPDRFKKFENYSVSRYKIFYIYSSDNLFADDVKELFPDFKFIGINDIKYFLRISSCLKFTARNELYKFLGLDLSDIGHPSSSAESRYIDSAVIIPESSSGFPEGIHVISFVMKAKDLMDCSYVFRKDNWENKIAYYQRLIEASKVGSIRKYLAIKKRTFIDNIIVSLPETVAFQNTNDNRSDVDICNLDSIQNLRIKIPYKINSIGVIDGQHRIFGHYEGNDSYESEIAKLRSKRHLLVTGLYYDPSKFGESEKRKFESELFLQINNEQKKVGKAVLHYIRAFQEPYSATGVANSVLELLNRRDPFLNLFILSPLNKVGVKTPTIIQYGLHDLVEINPNKETLFKYWKNPNKNLIVGVQKSTTETEGVLEEYLRFSTTSLSVYFSAIKSLFSSHWTLDNKSRLLTVTSIIAFLKAYQKSLEVYSGEKTFDFYSNKLKKLSVDFNKNGFPFVSSQWPKFTELINNVWD